MNGTKPKMISAYKDSVGVIFGILIGIIVFCYYSLQYADFKPEEFGLGLNTVKRIAYQDGKPLSFVITPDSIQLKHFAELREEGREITLWIGASQLYSVNKFKEGDKLAVEYANEYGRERSPDVINMQASSPNASLYDILVMYQVFRQEELFPKWLVIPIVYDDLRESGMQLSLLTSLRSISEETLDIGQQGIRNVNEEILTAAMTPVKKAPVARNAVAGTPQEIMENELIAVMNHHFPGYRHRNNIAAKIEIGLKIFLPKILSGIVKQAQEPEVLEHQKAWSNLALESLIQLALYDGCKVLLYKQPHRPTVGIFYHNREKYDEYFEWLAQKCKGLDDVHYTDLETIVPEQYWGLTNSGRPDVFHFTDQGHQLLGLNIDNFFLNLTTPSDSVIQ